MLFAIEVLDPGAVPGASTIFLRGRNRIDKLNKEIIFTQDDSAVNGSKKVNANDNRINAVAA